MLHLNKKQFGILVAAALILVSIIFVNTLSGYLAKKAELNALQEESKALQSKRASLERELEYVQSDDGIEMLAREYGWYYAGETCYEAVIVGSSGN